MTRPIFRGGGYGTDTVVYQHSVYERKYQGPRKYRWNNIII